MSSRSKAEPIVNDDEACFDTIRASWGQFSCILHFFKTMDEKCL